MKYHKISITFIATGLFLQLISFFVILPIASRPESWAVVYFFIFLLVFLLGVLDMIFGFLNLIKKKAYDLASIWFGALNSIMGFGFLLFIPGIIMIYLGLKEEDYDLGF